MSRVRGRKIPKEESRIDMINEMVQVARLYYEEELSQVQIAKQMKINQTKVSKLLNKAIENHVVQISISPNYSPIPELQLKIKKRFKHLNYLHISFVPEKNDDDLIEVLGYEGARYFIKNVKKNDSIGFSCGRNLEKLVSLIAKAAKDNSKNLPQNCEVYALVHPSMGPIVSITPAAIVASAVRQLPGAIGYAYQFPITKDNVDECGVSKYRDHKNVEMVLEKIKDLDIYFIGIGGKIEEVTKDDQVKKKMGLQFNRLVTDIGIMDELHKRGAVGECLHQPLGPGGKFLLSSDEGTETELDVLKKHILYLELEKLYEIVTQKEKKVVAIAGGENKHKALYSALKAEIFNALITDSTTALELVKMIEADKPVE